MDDFIKPVKTPKEADEVFDQLQPLLSQNGFELKKWISKNDAVTEAIPEDLKSISNTKQVEVEPNTEGSSLLGLHGLLLMIVFKCAELRTRKLKHL